MWFSENQQDRRPERWDLQFAVSIINAPNRNEAGIPALTRQDRPTEIVSLYFPFGSRVQVECKASIITECITERFSSFERKIFKNSVVRISCTKAK